MSKIGLMCAAAFGLLLGGCGQEQAPTGGPAGAKGDDTQTVVDFEITDGHAAVVVKPETKFRLNLPKDDNCTWKLIGEPEEGLKKFEEGGVHFQTTITSRDTWKTRLTFQCQPTDLDTRQAWLATMVEVLVAPGAVETSGRFIEMKEAGPAPTDATVELPVRTIKAKVGDVIEIKQLTNEAFDWMCLDRPLPIVHTAWERQDNSNIAASGTRSFYFQVERDHAAWMIDLKLAFVGSDYQRSQTYAINVLDCAGDACVDPFVCTQDSDCVFARTDCCGCQAGGTSIPINEQYRALVQPKCDGAPQLSGR